MTTNEPTPAPALLIRYRNHRGEVADRCIIPQRVWFGSCPPWHTKEQWLLDATDTDKGVTRTFALASVLRIAGPEEPPALGSAPLPWEGIPEPTEADLALDANVEYSWDDDLDAWIRRWAAEARAKVAAVEEAKCWRKDFAETNDMAISLRERVAELEAQLAKEQRLHEAECGANEQLCAERDRLQNEVLGLQKANELYRKGMESQCELMDGMKQELRPLKAERDRLLARVAELEAQPRNSVRYVDSPPLVFPKDDDE